MTKTIKKGSEVQIVEKNAVVEIPTQNNAPVYVNPYDKMIEMALTSDIDMDKLERIIALGKEHEADMARKAYFAAFAAFSENPPEISKDVHVAYQNKDQTWTKYKHADVGKSLQIIKAALAPHGLSINFKQKQEGGVLTVTCFLTHRLGYQESTSLSAAPDASGGKNGIQGTASTDSYLKRYTAFSITGLHAVGEDDDGRTAETQKPVELIDEKQESQLVDMILNFGQTIEAYCKLANITELKEIPKAEFNVCVANLTPAKD